MCRANGKTVNERERERVFFKHKAAHRKNEVLFFIYNVKKKCVEYLCPALIVRLESRL